MSFPRFDYEAIIFCTSKDIDNVESVTNCEMTRDLNNYYNCAPNSPAKKARKAKKSLELLAFFVILWLFCLWKPGKDRKARKFLALLKSLHRSSKKSPESQDLILASRRQSVKFDYRVNSKNSQESRELMNLSWDSGGRLMELTPAGISRIA